MKRFQLHMGDETSPSEGRKPRVLFMCVANSARSQLAEGLARSIFGDRAVIESAGSRPSNVNPYAIAALGEQGIDIAAHRSKAVAEIAPDFVQRLDYVITLCDEEVCPLILSNAKKRHWPYPDPAGGSGSDEEQLQRFRETRDAIRRRLVEFGREVGLV